MTHINIEFALVGDFYYKVSIRTGSGQHDGSDSDFFYTFIGTRRTSPEFKADIEEYDDREIDQLDEWSFTVSQDLGQFKCIRIRIDGGDGWRFYKVTVLYFFHYVHRGHLDNRYYQNFGDFTPRNSA